MEPSVVAPGRGQGQAYIWNPDDANRMRIFQMNNMAEMNRTRLAAAKAAREEQTKQAMDKMAMEGGKFGFYQPVFDAAATKFRKNFFANPDPKSRQYDLSGFKQLSNTFGANDEVLNNLFTRDLQDADLNNDQLSRAYTQKVLELSKDGQPALPAEIQQAVYNDPSIYNLPKIGGNWLKNFVGKEELETGDRNKSITIIKDKILDDNGNIDYAKVKQYALSDPKVRQAFLTNVQERVKDGIAPYGNILAPDHLEYEAVQLGKKVEKQVLQEMFAPTWGEYKKTFQYGPVGKGSTAKDPLQSMVLQPVETDTPDYVREVTGTLPDGTVLSRPISEERRSDFKTFGYALSGLEEKSVKTIASQLLAANTKVRPIGMVEMREFKPKAKEALSKGQESPDGTDYTLSKPYAAGEELLPQDVAKMESKGDKAKIDKPASKPGLRSEVVLQEYAKNGGSTEYVARAFAEKPFTVGNRVFKKGDPVPSKIANQQKDKVSIEIGFDLTPLQLQEGTESITENKKGITTRTTTGARNPMVNEYGKIFVSEASAQGLLNLMKQKAAQSGKSLEDIQREVYLKNGFEAPTKLSVSKFFKKATKQGPKSGIDF